MFYNITTKLIVVYYYTMLYLLHNIHLSAFARMQSYWMYNDNFFACNISKSSPALHMLKFVIMGKWRLGKCINEPACKKSMAST